MLFLNEFPKVPYEALNYMVAKANYGGRVTDAQDKRLIELHLSDYFNVDVVNNENHPLTESGRYVVPSDTDQAGYVEFAESLPIDDDCEIFGMHANAAITSDINATNNLLSVALSLQPRSAAAGGKSKDEILIDLAKSILD